MRKSFKRIAWMSCLVVACKSGTEPRVVPCTAQNSVMVGSLAVGNYTSFSPSGDGCALFAANAGADTIEYVVVAHSVSSDPNRSALFRLAGDAMVSPAASIMAALQAESPTSNSEAFHTMLRQKEARRDYGPLTPGAKLEMAQVQYPPTVGDQRTFKVCSSLTCQPPMRTVQAVVKAVGQRIAIYVDFETQNVFSQTEYDEMVALFDQRLYPLDTLAFGTESDTDGNGVVMVLMTPAINRLVTNQQCLDNGFVAGYFFGADLDPAAINNANYNHGEVFYTLVPDPSPGQYSCPHSFARVKQLVPQVFVHELQHMISFNHHVLRSGGALAQTEVLWLNEALSHYAEELAGRTYLPNDNATFSAYLNGNVRNAYDFLSESSEHFLLATFGSGTLGERGAGWLFMRYLVDQLAADTTMASWHEVTRELVQTTDVGANNIEARTGIPLEQTLSRWLLALWVSDLPGFDAPPELKYRSWRFRTTYGLLSPGTFPLPYPLVPGVSIGADVDIQGTLRAGTGVFERVRQPGGTPSFTLQLAEPDGGPVHPGVRPRLTIIRVK